MPSFPVRRVAGLLLLGLLLAASAYLWIMPLLRPREWRGDYLWGHYHLQDVYCGIPLLLVTLGAVIIALTPARARRAVGFRVAAVLLGVLVPLVVVDVGHALVWLGAWRPAYWLDLQHISRQENVADPRLGFRRKPNITWEGSGGDVEAPIQYRTDEHGFRNEPGITQADVVFIGDSYTEAAQVDAAETFVQRVAAATGRSVVNLGRGAYGPPQELIVLAEDAFRYRPKVVVWQLFEGNDLGDAQAFAEWRDDPDRVARSLFERYVQNSLFKPFLDATVRVKLRRHVRLERPDGTAVDMRLRYPWVVDYAAQKALGLAVTKEAIAEGARLCREHGARLLVVFLPIMARVNAEHLVFPTPEDRRRNLPAVADPPPQWVDLMAAHCGALGVSFLDLTPPLRAASAVDPSGLYIPTDEHFGLRGHAIVAAAIAGWVDRALAE